MEGHPLAEKARRLQGIKYRARSPHDSSEATSSNSGGSENQLSASSTESGASDEGAHLVSVESPRSEEHYYRQTFAEDDPNAVYNTFHM
ncbi:hypothetical protein ADEAN_000568900 [Angomonas deanei]|uniref:Uncharacterized protein n=1 Tax=Angomonas deanei TaxID=59799 RepID=A0A7G2CIX1_9TRYP|nr:hypothetical protein ADEAN_000568900 [Angomonas deanei]